MWIKCENEIEMFNIWESGENIWINTEQNHWFSMNINFNSNAPNTVRMKYCWLFRLNIVIRLQTRWLNVRWKCERALSRLSNNFWHSKIVICHSEWQTFHLKRKYYMLDWKHEQEATIKLNTLFIFITYSVDCIDFTVKIWNNW